MYEIKFKHTTPVSSKLNNVIWDVYVPIWSEYRTYNYPNLAGNALELSFLFRNMQSEGIVVTPVFDGPLSDVGHYLFWPPRTTDFSDEIKALRINAQNVAIEDIRAVFEYVKHQANPAEQGSGGDVFSGTCVLSEELGRSSHALFADSAGRAVPEAKEQTSPQYPPR
jgi:hypothetical protein